MARTREEREQFFADLERLDQLSDDESDGRPNIAPDISPAVPACPDPVAEQFARKRKISSSAHQPRPQPKPAQSATEILRPSTSDAATHPSETISAPTLRRTQSEKTAPAQEGKKGKKKAQKIVPVEDRVFEGLVFFFIPNKDDDPVRRIRINLAIAHGASWARSWDEPVTHVIIDRDLPIARASREFQDKMLPDGVPVVKDEWLVECLKYKHLRDLKGIRFRVLGMSSPYALETPKRITATSAHAGANAVSRTGESQVRAKGASRRTPERRTSPLQSSTKDQSNDELDQAIREMQKLRDIPASLLEDDPPFSADSVSSFSSFDEEDTTMRTRNMNGFVCMEKNDGSNNNPNARTIDILQKLATRYEKICDQWRTKAFRMAASALRKQQTLIRTKEEALRIRGIGKSVAGQIQEFVTSDRLRRLDSAEADPTDHVLGVFMGIYGAGDKEAHRWFAQGHRTLDDVRKKGDLTANQRVGLEHYDDFQQRIPRAEVEQHAAIVKAALHSVDKELELIVGGSYRRGSSDCGDIDILIMKKDVGREHLHTLMTHSVIPLLTKRGFLKFGFATGNSRTDGSKWHGASCLPGSSVWRRIDLLYVPWEERGAALIYFTGNDIFNRSIRCLAGRRKMRLNQHGLFKDVLRGPGRVKVTEGELVEASSERRIFEVLGATYRPPEHRIC